MAKKTDRHDYRAHGLLNEYDITADFSTGTGADEHRLVANEILRLLTKGYLHEAECEAKRKRTRT